MGTQFWWFYDVLAVAMTFIIGYAVIAKGFNKVVFQLAAFLLSMTVGVLGANFIAPKVYDELFREKIGNSIMAVLDDETFDLYEQVAESLALTAAEEETPPTAEELHKTFLRTKRSSEAVFEEWYTDAFGSVLGLRLNNAQKMHPIDQTKRFAERFDQNGWIDLLSAFEEGGQREEIRDMIEVKCYRDNYTQLVRLALFLIIELVMLIISCIIASMTDHLEESMHLRRSNHLLAVPVALVEAGSMLFVFCVIVRLIVQITDSEMLLFNQPSIDATFLFKYIYSAQDFLFGGTSH